MKGSKSVYQATLKGEERKKKKTYINPKVHQLSTITPGT